MNSAIVVYRALGRILIQLERIISVVGFALIRTFKKAEMLVYSENNESNQFWFQKITILNTEIKLLRVGQTALLGQIKNNRGPARLHMD